MTLKLMAMMTMMMVMMMMVCRAPARQEQAGAPKSEGSPDQAFNTKSTCLDQESTNQQCLPRNLGLRSAQCSH